MGVTVRYWAAARAAAGTAEETYDGVDTLAGLLTAVSRRHSGDDLPRVLARCSYLVDEVSPGKRAPGEVPVRDTSVVEVLPPFAGGAGPREQSPGGGPGTRRTGGGVRQS